MKPWLALGSLLAAATAGTAAAEFVSEFSCDGGKRAWPLDFAADATTEVCKNPQEMGGRTMITIVEARNLPNMDSGTPTARQSDPYIRATLFNTEYTTSTVDSSLDPVWPSAKATADFGIRASGAPIKLEVWDEDSGLEGADDLLGTVTTHVIACSELWPSFPCEETAWLPLEAGQSCLTTDNVTTAELVPGVACLKVKQVVNPPYQVRILEQFEDTETLDTAVAGASAGQPSDSSVGVPWVGSSDLVNAYDISFQRARGGVFVRTYNQDKTSAKDKYIRFTVNMDSDLYVFLSENDFSPVRKVPSWLDPATDADGRYYGYGGWNSTTVGFSLQSSSGAQSESFDGFHRNLPAGKAITLGGPRVGILDKSEPSRMYCVVVKMKPTSNPVPPDYSKPFDRAKFFELFAQFGLVFLIFAALVLRFMAMNLQWRVDHVPVFLAALTMLAFEGEELKRQDRRERSRARRELASTGAFGDDEGQEEDVVEEGFEVVDVYGNVLTVLLRQYSTEGDDDNFLYRRNSWYLQYALYTVMLTPAVILFSWGWTASAVMSPANVGHALLFVVPAIALIVHGVICWRRNAFRMEPSILAEFSTAFALLIVFEMGALIVDKRPFSLFPVSIVFFTLNALPLTWIAFLNDPSLQNSFKDLVGRAHENTRRQLSAVRMSEADDGKGLAGKLSKLKGKKKKKKKKGKGKDKAQGAGEGAEGEVKGGTPTTGTPDAASLAVPAAKHEATYEHLVGSAYTMEEGKGHFRLVDAMNTSFTGSPESRRRISGRLYGVACFWYLVYVIVVAVGSDEFAAHGLLNAFFLMVTDSALYLLRGRGEGSWSPGFTCVLVLGVRFLVAAGNGDYWVLGHGAAFLLIGTAVGGEVVYKYLPRMSVGRTAAIAYFGHDTDRKPPTDVAGFPEFVLGYLCFVYLVELLAFIFNEPEGGFAPINMVDDKWPVWVFGILALIIVLNVTAARATWRSFTLQRRQLLLTAKHFWDPRMGFPYMMAAFTEILLVCSGVLIFGMTGSAFLLLLLVFLPLVVVSGGLVLAQWVRNDFQLLEDPIKRKRPEEEEGEEGGDAPESAPATEAPSLPAMRRAQSRSSSLKITMPTLPLKKPKVKKPAAADNQEGGKARGEEGEEPAAAAPTGAKAGSTKAGDGGDEEDEDAPAGGLDALEAAMEEGEAASDPVTMYWWEALRKGALTKADYATLAVLAVHYLLTFIMGLVIGAAVQPAYVGYVLWTLVMTLELTLAPVVKYFNVYYWTTDMKVQLPLGFLFFLVSVFSFFGGTLGGSINTDWALFLLAVGMWYPAVVALAAAIFKWRDDGWRLSPFVTHTFIGVFALSLCWFWTVFPWTHGYTQPTLVFLYLAAIALFFYTKHWSENDFYWSPTVRKWTRRSVLFAAVIFILIALSADVEAFYFFSFGFLLLMSRLCSLPLERYVFIEPGAPVFFSTFVFPIYAYDPGTNDVVSENRAGGNFFAALGVALIWGVSSIIFVDPLGIGATITSAVLLGALTASMHLISLAPRMLSQSTLCCDDAVFAESGIQAQETFESRNERLDIVCEEYRAPEEAAPEADGGAYTYQVEDMDGGGARAPDDDRVGRVTARAAAERLDFIAWTMRYLDGPEVARDEATKRRDRPFSWREAAQEAYYQGLGPFGWLFVWGMVHEGYMRLFGRRKLRRRAYDASGEIIPEGEYSDSDDEDEYEEALQRFATEREGSPDDPEVVALAEGVVQKRKAEREEMSGMTRAEKEVERDRRARELLLTDQERAARERAGQAPKLHVLPLLLEVPELEEALAKAFTDELRCIVHFQVLVVVATDARIRRERILFQKFLRETRFKLMANGVAPPDKIFASQSYSTVDVGLVANWLKTCTPEQRERFHMLKARFSQDVEEREARADEEVALVEQQEAEMRRWRMQREWEMNTKRWEEFQRRRLQRQEQGRDLTGGEEDEAVVNAKESLAEIKGGWATKPGTMGRAKQFVDPDFPPDASSVGNCFSAAEIRGWRTALEINRHSTLFAEGTDPDDIFQGHLHDGWLLSAISILAASGGVGDGDVDYLIDRLFITKETSDTGAYAVRFYKNSQWETVLVDDYFPTLDDSYKLTPSAGAAFAYSRSFEEVWVPVLEKAYAKYHGSYAMLESGFVHHALADLTGGTSEEIFLLRASRGANKKLLWSKLRKYHRNGYLLGAGTVSSSAADRSITDSGLVWGAAYVIFEVRDIDGHQLLKLRNPPDYGEGVGEWKGDWSDKSELWTRRLKNKLGHEDRDDGTWWMSFDDFCIAFRSLYVCRYYNPARWRRQEVSSWWRGDTAAGLPAVANRGCKVENNPQYALTVNRPTDVALTLAQNENGIALETEPHPIALYVVDTGARVRALRVTELTNSNVLACSGDPVRQFEVSCYATLQPGTYTVLMGTYLAGMEGPFTLSLHSSFDVDLRQLWPPPHRGVEGVDDLEAGVGANMMSRARRLGGAAAGAVKRRVGQGSAGAKDFEDEMEREMQQRGGGAGAGSEAADADDWEEAVDPNTGALYFHNTATGVSQWTKPEGYLTKEERAQRDAERRAAGSL